MADLNQYDIPSDVIYDIERTVDILLGKYEANINRIFLFGSYATGKYQPDSDIDIAVVLNELPPLKERLLYKQAVELERDVDLLFCTAVQLAEDVLVYKRINEQGMVLYEQL